MKCSICTGVLKSIGTVPFDRNNQEVPVVDTTPMEYYKCETCCFVCCPEMLSWTPEMLGARVYNSEYVKYDPDYLGTRPKNYADSIHRLTLGNKAKIKHLDYGSGSGIMSKLLSEKGWNSRYCDPYGASNTEPGQVFNFITAIEVVEHALDINATIAGIKSMLDPRTGTVLFSTQLADANTNIDWWYIGARNGHIGILSAQSLKILAKRHGLFFSSLNSGMHLLQPTRNNFKDLILRYS